MALIVYGSSVSPFVRKVCVVLSEKGLKYTLEQAGPFNPTPEFLAASPLKKMPALRDTSIPEPNTLADSSVICDYIESKYPEPALYPKEPYSRARALWFEEYADTTMGICITAGLFFERFVKRLMGQQPNEEICRKTLEEHLPPMFDYLDKEIGDNEFLVGGALTIADISIASMLANLDHLGEDINPVRWPRLCAYTERLLQRPAFKLLIEEETPFVQRILAA
jgi:glutathione S-transferase